MGWMPGATVRDVGAGQGRFTNGPMGRYVGVVLHVNDSQGDQLTSVSGDSLYDWIIGNHGMSCHFQVSQMGLIEQYIPTELSSWCQSAGNDTYLSVETEGHPDTPLTDAQVHAVARIVAYAHREHGIPLAVADFVGASGLGWHGMGAGPWGGHLNCPGEPRKAQRAEIVSLAAGLATEGSGTPISTITEGTDDDMFTDKDRAMMAYIFTQIRGGVAQGQTSFAGTTKAALATAQAQVNAQRATAAQLTAIKAELAKLSAAGVKS